MSAGERLLTVAGLTLRFGAVTAFDDVSFTLDRGEILAIIGPNGAGKTSLFNALTGVYRPSAGRVVFGEYDITDVRPHYLPALGIARTFQNLGLFGPMTVLENVLVGRHHLMRSGPLAAGLRMPWARREEREHREAALRALRSVGIGELAGELVDGLPYGQCKRVEVARAIAMEPKLLLLDEPVAGIAAAQRGDVAAVVRRMRDQLGITLLLVEHDMDLVMAVADRVLVLDFGRTIALGPPAEIQRDPAVIRAYLGEPDDEPAIAGFGPPR